MMLSKWEYFEISCTEYLNREFGNCANFEHKGGPNSTIPDIKVTTKSGNIFYIEVKHSPAQCGQFVLHPDITSNTFIYSHSNITPINTYALQIINYMNDHFNEFINAGTAGKDIIMDTEIFSNWIISNYKNKDVRYFITNNYTIVPIEKINEYFYVSAKYRVKRSGSKSVGKNNISDVMEYIHSSSYDIKNMRTENRKLFVVSTDSLHNLRFRINDCEYMFSLRDSEYEVRRLSNTFNANVIFLIDLKPNKNGIRSEEFKKALE